MNMRKQNKTKIWNSLINKHNEMKRMSQYTLLTSMAMPKKEYEEVYTCLILPLLNNSVINLNQFTSWTCVTLYAPI